MHNYPVNSVYHIAKADFLQRIRSYNFLIALGISVFLIYTFVPPLSASYRIVSLGNYRGLYNSAWIGGMVASCVPFFALIGFYLINYAVKRDVDTGVGQIVATTRISNIQYLSGKLLSNFAVLLAILLVIMAMTIIMFLVRGETNHIEFDKLLLPLIFLVAPAMFIIACIALFFDTLTISINRGIVNIIYFFLWTFLISSGLISPLLDILGTDILISEIKNTLSITHHDWNGDFGTGIMLAGSSVNNQVFIWDGMNWSISLLFFRLFWMMAFLGLIFLSLVSFNRFDDSKIGKSQRRIKIRPKKRTTRIDEMTIHPPLTWQNAPQPEARFSFFSILKAEIHLMVKGRSKLWLIVTSILFTTSLFAPVSFAYKISLPLLWFFQILILSKIGCREINNRCNGYIFSAAFPIRRQLPATFTAASLLMFFLALPVVLRTLLNADFYSVYAITAGALFIPSFAITLGILTGGSKLFEVLFTIIVYGYFNDVPFFDFTGAIQESHFLGMANYFLIITLILIILAFLVRKRQIRHTQ